MFSLSKSSALLIAAGAVALLSGTANAEDWNPAPFRGGNLSTLQEWDFNTEVGANGIQPDGTLGWYNEGKVGDTPLAINGGGVAWDNGILYGSGNGGSYIDFFVPNWIDREPYKLIWLQIHGNWGPNYSDFPVFGQNVWGSHSTVDGVYEGSRIFSSDNDAVHLTEAWFLTPNPDHEWIRVFLPEGTQVTQVVIDTISFPAPGAVAAFGLAGLVGSRRRR